MAQIGRGLLVPLIVAAIGAAVGPARAYPPFDADEVTPTQKPAKRQYHANLDNRFQNIGV